MTGLHTRFKYRPFVSCEKLARQSIPFARLRVVACSARSSSIDEDVRAAFGFRHDVIHLRFLDRDRLVAVYAPPAGFRVKPFSQTERLSFGLLAFARLLRPRFRNFQRDDFDRFAPPPCCRPAFAFDKEQRLDPFNHPRITLFPAWIGRIPDFLRLPIHPGVLHGFALRRHVQMFGAE